MSDAKVKLLEREQHRKEVHERLVLQTKRKKGFLTPQRKQALRRFIIDEGRKHIITELNRRANERKKIIEQRVGQPKSIVDADKSTLIALCKQYQDRIYKLNEDKWDLEMASNLKELTINEQLDFIKDQRGKFSVPPLKKVFKYEAQLEKMRQWTYKLAKMDMRGALKPVKKEMDEKLPKKEAKPEWAAANKSTTASSGKTGDKDEEINEMEEEDDEEEQEIDEEVEEVELKVNY